MQSIPTNPYHFLDFPIKSLSFPNKKSPWLPKGRTGTKRHQLPTLCFPRKQLGAGVIASASPMQPSPFRARSQGRDHLVRWSDSMIVWYLIITVYVCIKYMIIYCSHDRYHDHHHHFHDYYDYDYIDDYDYHFHDYYDYHDYYWLSYWWLLMIIDDYWWLLMIIDDYWWLLLNNWCGIPPGSHRDKALILGHQGPGQGLGSGLAWAWGPSWRMENPWENWGKLGKESPKTWTNPWFEITVLMIYHDLPIQMVSFHGKSLSNQMVPSGEHTKSYGKSPCY